MELTRKTPHPTPADSAAARRLEAQRTKDAQRETQDMEKGKPMRRPVQPLDNDGRRAHG